MKFSIDNIVVNMDASITFVYFFTVVIQQLQIQGLQVEADVGIWTSDNKV